MGFQLVVVAYFEYYIGYSNSKQMLPITEPFKSIVHINLEF